MFYWLFTKFCFNKKVISAYELVLKSSHKKAESSRFYQNVSIKMETSRIKERADHNSWDVFRGAGSVFGRPVRAGSARASRTCRGRRALLFGERCTWPSCCTNLWRGCSQAPPQHSSSGRWAHERRRLPAPFERPSRRARRGSCARERRSASTWVRALLQHMNFFLRILIYNLLETLKAPIATESINKTKRIAVKFNFPVILYLATDQ